MKAKLVASAVITLVLAFSLPGGAKAVGVGKQCGGFPNIQCDSGLFCQKKPGQCNVIDTSGTCARIPKFCPKHILPVCGCDGRTYNNDCERQQAMVSLAHKGKCQ